MTHWIMFRGQIADHRVLADLFMTTQRRRRFTQCHWVMKVYFYATHCITVESATIGGARINRD